MEFFEKAYCINYPRRENSPPDGFPILLLTSIFRINKNISKSKMDLEIFAKEQYNGVEIGVEK